MKWRSLAMLWAGAGALTGALGLSCSGDAQNSAGGAAGISGAGNLSGAGGVSADSAGSVGHAGNAGSADQIASACLEHPIPQRTQGTVVSLPLQLVLTGKPFVFGQPNALADGGSLVPLNLRFYISEVQLLRTGGEQPLAVDVVTGDGAPEPYGVHLFNAEDEDSSTLRLLAPPGQYSGLSFALGIKLSCNQQTPANLTDPLTDTSQMTWPHTGGFLFFRYEGRYTPAGSAGAAAAGTAAEIPPAVHMGGSISSELVPRVSVLAPVTVPASGTLEKGLRVVMDQLFQGATSDVDVSDVSVGLLSTPESEAGERLRRELPHLQAFELEP